ncbi:hypothetical protein ES704_01512 [subsurface metagenome]|jgi:hypothetical protein
MANKNIDALVIHHKPINEIILKRLILIFDHIHIINPEENNYLIPDKVAKIKNNKMEIILSNYGTLYNGNFYKKIESQLIDKFDYAYRKGIIRIDDLKAGKFYNKYWLPLRLAYDFDTANKSLIDLSKKLLEKNSNAETNNGIIRGFFSQPSGSKIYPDIPKMLNVFSEEENKKYKYDIQSFSTIGKLNRSLVVCGEYNLIPVFIDSTIAKMFIEKCKIARDNPETELNSKFKETNNVELQNVQYLLYKMTENILPDKIITEIPIKELIIARNNTFQELHKLRRKLLSSITFLTKNKFDANFREEAEMYINKEFKPQLKKYYSKFWGFLEKYIGYPIIFTSTFIGSSIGLMQFLSPFEVAFFSSISAMVGTSVTNKLSDYIIKTDKNKFKNTYCYFLYFRE